VGLPLLSSLADSGMSVYAISRYEQDLSPNPRIRWIKADLEGVSVTSELPNADVLVHVAPLWLLPKNLQLFIRSGVRRVVAFSSTSAETKTAARDRREREIAEKLQRAETECHRLCKRHDVGLTVFRPTLIYGFGRDRNVTTIAQFIRRFGFFAVAGEARGRRQPVHAMDLVASCISVLDNSNSLNRTYNLSGGEVLTYGAMVGRIFEGLDKPSRIVHLPVSLYRMGLRCMTVLNGRSYYSPDVADRMNRDLCFSHQQATTDFGYRPTRFLIDPEQDLHPT
jgi:nucleoside-diphosphate-sugar epimerase